MKKLTRAEFIEAAKAVYGNKYDYSQVDELNLATAKVTVVCPEHGEFMISPSLHIRGVGCPKCLYTEEKKD